MSVLQYDCVKLSEFNLRVGYPTIVDIESGREDFKYIEVTEPNSLVYIGFALLHYDINFRLLKYKVSSNDNQTFKEIISVEKINATDAPIKLIAFVPEPGVYKAVWDNTYSWLNSKKLRIRISILKAVEYDGDGLNVSIESKITCHNNNSTNIKSLNSELSVVSQEKSSKEPTSLTVSVLDEKEKNKINRFESSEYTKLKLNLKNLKKTLYFPHNEERMKLNNNTDLNIICDKSYFYTYNYETQIFSRLEKTEDVLVNIVKQAVKSSDNSNIINVRLFNYHENKKAEINEINQEEDFIDLLGFFPKAVVNFITSETKMNFKFMLNNLCESLLYNSIYNQFCLKKPSNSISSILMISIIENQIPVVFLFQDTQIYDNLKGLKYDTSKSSLENAEFIANFINKSQMLFEDFNIEITVVENDSDNDTNENEKSPSQENNEESLVKDEVLAEAIPKEINHKLRLEELEKILKEKCTVKENYYLKVLGSNSIKSMFEANSNYYLVSN